MNHTRISCKRLIAVLLCLACILALTSCGSVRMAQRQIFAMDTVMTLTAYGKKADAALDAAASVIYSMQAELDPDVPTSTTYAINHAEGKNVVVSAQIAKMLSTAKTVYDRSDGALDLSIYPVVYLWGFTNGHYYVPTYEEISAQLARKAYDRITLTSYPATGSYSVSFPAGTEISFGAIGKGCAAENAVSAMRQAGAESGIVSLGGNVQTFGSKPGGDKWTVAVQDPNNTANWVGTVRIGEAAVVTSGSYQRFFEFGGNTYHHILNPLSGSQSGVNQASMAAPMPKWADAASASPNASAAATKTALRVALFFMPPPLSCMPVGLQSYPPLSSRAIQIRHATRNRIESD